jgi:branched-subunit amino acid ABC-type transport system permease component
VNSWLLFGLLGLGSGAVYAALATGLILIHRGSAVLNLALGAMTMYPAMVFVRLRASGELIFPVVVLPGRINVGGPWPTLPAFVVAVLLGTAVGALSYVVIFRRLREAPPVTRLVASVGLTIVLQGGVYTQVGAATRRSEPVLPGDVVKMLGSPVPVDRFWLAGLVVVIGAALAALYRFTRFGISTRAAAESEKGAVLLGYSPARLGLLNWVLASAFASVVGVLVSPISGVNPFNYSLFVVAALAAALAARLRSFGVAMAVGLGIGMFQGISVHVVSRRQVPSFLFGGFDTMFPLVAIVLALVWAGRSVPDRGTLLEHRHPAAPRPNLTAPVYLALGLAAFVMMIVGSSQLRLAAITSMSVILLCLSIVVLTGYVGQVSLAQLSLAGFAAFMLSRFADRWGVPFPFGPIMALTVTTLLGIVIGLPALRIRGIQFAIVTLAAAVTIEQLLFRNPGFVGFGGIAHVDPPQLFGFEFGIVGPGEYPYRPFGIFVLAITIAAIALVINVRRGALGRRFLAVRSNERAASAAGVNVARTKIIAAGLSSFLAGLSGIVFAYKNIDFSWAGLESARGLQLLALAYLGGVGSVAGAVIAGVLAPSGVLLVTLGSPGGLGPQLLLTGFGLIIVCVKFPGGIASGGRWAIGVLARTRAPLDPGRDPRPAGDDTIEIELNARGVDPDRSTRRNSRARG